MNQRQIQALQDKINRSLKVINPRYRIRNLKMPSPDNFWFDLAMSFNPHDMDRVNRVFKDLLEIKPAARKQAKFYLSEQVYQRLREQAVKEHRSQSELVEEALKKTVLA